MTTDKGWQRAKWHLYAYPFAFACGAMLFNESWSGCAPSPAPCNFGLGLVVSGSAAMLLPVAFHCWFLVDRVKAKKNEKPQVDH
jgi:hypothetical protein